MTSTNRTQIARARETTLGVAASAPFEKCFLTGESLKVAKNFIRSETITGDRLIAEHIAAGIAVEGSTPFEAAYHYWDWALELAFMNSFAAAVEAYNITADSVITDVVAATDTVTAAGAWAEGMLVRMSGFTNAGNNQRFRAESGSGAGSLVAPAAPGLTDEAAPPAGARAVMVGFEGATGDITATATGLGSTALDFTTLGLTVGQAVKIGGSAVGNKFATAANNTYVHISAISANALDFADLPTGWTVDTGVGVAVQVFVGDFLETGNSVITDTLQKAFLGQPVPQYLSYLGVAAQNLSVNLAERSLVTGSLGIIGVTGGILGGSGSAYDANPVTPTVGPVMKTGAGVLRITEGDSPIATTACAKSLSLSLANNVQPISCLDLEQALDYDLGDAEFTINATFRGADLSKLTKFYGETDSALSFVVGRGIYAYAFRCLAATYTDGNIEASGRNAQADQVMVLQGKKHAATGKMLTCTRFRETS